MRICTYMYTYTYIYMYMYVCIGIFVYIYIDIPSRCFPRPPYDLISAAPAMSALSRSGPTPWAVQLLDSVYLWAQGTCSPLTP